MSGSQGLHRFVTGTGPATWPPRLAGPTGRPAGTGRQTAGQDKCEFCAAEIPVSHGHVADLEQSSLLCACRACYLLFTRAQAGPGRYRAVPDRYLADPSRPMSPGEWEVLEIPVGLAFFMRDSRQGEVTGFYPSPAGATRCELDLRAWGELVASHPLLATMAPDVEATLIYRSDESVEYFVVPVDACYELAGRMRLLWHGFDGGDEAKDAIASFMGHVRGQARSFGQEA